jgi:DNA-binding NarL/FixJ family response regulator
MADGRSNHGIAGTLRISDAAVERHITAILSKLDLMPIPTDHRRVMAVLAYLRNAAN